MIVSSAFVLTALTMTGVYMQSRDQESRDDGYIIDFTALEDNVENKYEEILDTDSGENENVSDGQLDDMEDNSEEIPLEAGSSQVENPGITGKGKLNRQDVPDENITQAISVGEPETPGESENPESGEQPGSENPESEEQPGSESLLQSRESAVISQELHFSESEGLLRPVSGEAVIPFNTESSVYFSTLDQYKRNTAMMLKAKEGTSVSACADGKVIDIFENEEIGHAITMELGDGYRITYGQLRDIQVALGSYVNSGDTFASVAAPTKYYVREGSNLYLKLTVNGAPVNPEPLFQ